MNEVNHELTDQELYISHFLEEDQVILRQDWRIQRIQVKGSWKHLDLYRLGDLDLLLCKLMRDDPIDLEDAIFIYEQGHLDIATVAQAFQDAKIPDIHEIKEQFVLASHRFLHAISDL